MKAATVGASVPTTADTVNFFSNSSATSAYTVTLSGALNCASILASSNTPTFAGTGTLGVSGTSFTIGVGMTWSATGLITFTGSPNVTTNGVTINSPITYNAVGGTMTLADALTLGTLRSATLTNGTINLNGKTMTVLSFITASGVKNITFNGGTLVVNGSFNNSFPTSFTTTAGTGVGTISMVGASGKNFLGGGVTFSCTLNQGGTGSLTITGSSTFDNITNTTQPASVFFTSGTTNTFNNFNLSGTAGNLITIRSVTAGTQATISKASGTVSVSYCAIQDINATGGATWNALTSNGCVDNGGNTGWIFAALLPSLYVNTNVFYSATVSSANTLAPPLYANTNTFYGPTVAARNTLAPALFANTNTFYTATVAAGAVNLAPALYTNTNTFYGAVVSQGGTVLQPSLYIYTNLFYVPTVSLAAFVIAPALFANTNTFYSPTISARNTLAPALFANQNVFYSPQITIRQFLYPDLFVNVSTFYNTFVYLYPFHPNDLRPSGPSVAGGPRGAMPAAPNAARQNLPLSSTPRQPMPFE